MSQGVFTLAEVDEIGRQFREAHAGGMCDLPCELTRGACTNQCDGQTGHRAMHCCGRCGMGVEEGR